MTPRQMQLNNPTAEPPKDADAETIHAPVHEEDELKAAASIAMNAPRGHEDHQGNSTIDNYAAEYIHKLLDATNENSSESMDDLRSQTRRTLYNRISGSVMLAEERKKGNLGVRMVQSIVHQSLTYARIYDLEDKLRKLEQEVRNLPPEREVGDKMMQCPVFMPILKRSLADEFRTSDHSRSLPPSQKAALEVLVSENYYKHEPNTPTDQNSGDSLQHDIKSRATLALAHETAEHQENWVPERLRIRSWALAGYLERVCKDKVAITNIIDAELSESSPCVLLQPFKLLVTYEREIKNSVEEVERLAKEAEGADEHGQAKKGSFQRVEFRWQDLLRDLNLLVEFLNVDLKSTFELREAIRNGTATNIEYNDLWHLFNLGDTVVARGKRDQAYRVVNYVGGRDALIWRMGSEEDRVPPLNGFVVDCCSVQFNGTAYVSNLHQFLIRRYIGRRPIDSLEVYPLHLDPDADALRDSLLTQGQHYLETTKQPFFHQMHRGRTLDEPPQDLEGQVIVDIAMALNAEPEWMPTSTLNPDDLAKKDMRETQIPPWCTHGTYSEGCCGSDTIHKDLDMVSDLSHPFLKDYGGLSSPRTAEELGEDVLLLPNWVRGFVLRLRRWATLKMDNLSEVSFENDFNQLMISENHKKTILAVVETHEKSRVGSGSKSIPQSVGTSLDLIKGKGTGLIILLHGEPGVGKTSTAECVADRTKRPLFPITCGDIGETAMEVEMKLQQNFRLAHRWDSVLLLDEADVFLAKRNKTDLRRNAVTSVFLRSLDYYAGILFLTTNRVGGIDPAFKSRIHLSVYYPRLGLDTTLSLYEAFLQRAKAEQAKSQLPPTFRFRDKEILRFAKRHYRQMNKQGYNTWNGRQIRNAFQIAIALVEYDAAQLAPGSPKLALGKTHFEIVAEGSKEFDNYLMRTLQGADDEIAFQDQWRDDHFTLDMAAGSEHSRHRSHRTTGPVATDRRKGSAIALAATRHDDSDSLQSDEDSESESESEDETSDEGNSSQAPAQKDKKGKAQKAVVAANTADTTDDLKEYEEYLKFKALKRAKEQG